MWESLAVAYVVAAAAAAKLMLNLVYVYPH